MINLIHIIDCYYWIWIQSAIDNECCLWLWGSNANANYGKIYRGPAPFHRLTPNKRFEPVFSTVIMAVCSLFNKMLLLTDLIPVHLLYCGQTVMIGCNHTSFEWTRAVHHIYGIIPHMQGLYSVRDVYGQVTLMMMCFHLNDNKEVNQ